MNGTFYSLKSPSIFARWATEVPDRGFVFAIKGGRFITHNLKLRNCERALGNFFASGLLALGAKTGPFLWQLPATYRFEAERLDRFMRMLPRDSLAAEDVARHHDHRLKQGALLEAVDGRRIRYRHAFEVRHPSYFCEEFYDILRANHCALVFADTAGKFGYAEELTTDFIYARLHGSTELYASGYTDSELDDWAARIRRWRGRSAVTRTSTSTMTPRSMHRTTRCDSRSYCERARARGGRDTRSPRADDWQRCQHAQ